MTAITEQEQRRDDEPQNEPVHPDLELPDDKAEDVLGGAGCPSWMCGTSGNHNEVLAVTA